MADKKSYKEIINIVSGLPRSGTSMMMKMLEAGGIPVLIDNIRKADVDNPKGYYEFERVKQIAEDKEWMDDAVGKVVKMVSMLLLDLPGDRHYKVVFMRRDMKEALASQRKMLERIDGQEPVTKEDAEKEDRVMDYNYRKHLIKTLTEIEKRPNVDIMYVKYNDILSDPKNQAEEVNAFFNNELDLEAMSSVVDPKLYRNRAEKKEQ